MEHYRNPEVGQSPACLWECVADQLSRRGPAPVTASDVRKRCLSWLQANESAPMGPHVSLPEASPPPGGTRCSLGQYVSAAYQMSWAQYTARLELPETWADVVCLWAVAAAWRCTVLVCSKTFPYPDFFCAVGSEGPQLLLMHWRAVQFRSVLSRGEWDVLYERVKREKGLAALDHRLYSGLLRYQDRTEEAIMHCKLEVERDPRSLVGHHTWSIVLSDNFRAEEAMQHYLAQLEVAPNHPHSYNGVGTTLHDLRRYDDAIFFYKAQLYFNPRNKYSHLNMSLAYARLKQFEAAEREHMVQLAMHPTDRNTCDYYLELLSDMKESERGVLFFARLVEQEPWRNEWRFHLARAYVSTKDFTRAAHQLQVVLRNNPNDCRALGGLAELFERTGYYLRAASILRKLLVVFPRHPRARSFLGDVLVKSGQYDEAEAILKDQMRTFPHDSEAYSRMAELLAQRGDTEDAIAMYKRSRTVDPTDSSSLFNIGLCYLDLHRFNEARAYFQRHLAENPGDPVSLLEIANTHYAEGERELSIRGYRAVLEIRPDHHDCRAWLAGTLLESGRPLDAVAEYETLIRMTGRTAFHYNISYIYTTLSEAPDTEPAEQLRLRRLADVHAQLETGVRRAVVEQFYRERCDGLVAAREAAFEPVQPHRLALRTALVVREDALPYGLDWSPEVHRLCSPLARQQVRLLLLLCLRAEQRVGYPFPREIKRLLIQLTLQPPSEGLVRSVVPAADVPALFDARETVCFRPAPSGFTPLAAVALLAEGGARVVHATLLHWPATGGLARMDSVVEAPGEEPVPPGREGALYVTFASRQDAARGRDVVAAALPVGVALGMLKCSPAELRYVPYVRCALARERLAPYEGAVGLFVQQALRNRQMCEAAADLRGAADDALTLETLVAYMLGDEPGVKVAIHDLLMEARREPLRLWPCFNAAMVVYLLLIRFEHESDGDGDGGGGGGEDLGARWTRHFAARSEYALALLRAADALEQHVPTGEALFRMGLVLGDVATLVEDPATKATLFGRAIRLLELQAERSPRHPHVHFLLGQLMTTAGRPSADCLRCFEEASKRNPMLGHMEAAALLLEADRKDEAFAHLEAQVAVDPRAGFGMYAIALSVSVRRRFATLGKAARKAMLDEVRRLFDVYAHLRESLPPGLEEAGVRLALDEFNEWDALTQGPMNAQPNRVEFVPRIEETPFGVDDDFEKEFL